MSTTAVNGAFKKKRPTRVQEPFLTAEQSEALIGRAVAIYGTLQNCAVQNPDISLTSLWTTLKGQNMPGLLQAARIARALGFHSVESAFPMVDKVFNK